jgi:hypothetical protein
MSRVWILAAATLVGATGAGLASAAVTPSADGSVAASPAPTPHGAATTPRPRAVTPVRPQTTDAAAVQGAMRAVLASAGVGFEVFDRTTSTVLTSHLADQRFAAMSQVKLLIALDVLARGQPKGPGRRHETGTASATRAQRRSGRQPVLDRRRLPRHRDQDGQPAWAQRYSPARRSR